MSFKALPKRCTALEPVHACLSVAEILRAIATELVKSGARATAVALALCCKTLEDPVLDTLWKTQDQLLPLLKSFPGDAWNVEGGRFSFSRIPTKADWSRFGKYARRMERLEMDLSRDLIDSGVLSALQLRTGNDTLLPRLWSFECKGATEAFIPFIPLFLTHKIAHVHVAFAVNSPVVVASTIARLWTWCPNIQRITLNQLPESPVVTEALSEMVLACNRDTLLSFLVNSPLTVEAREVLYNLPKLRHLWAVLQGPTPPPQIALSNLATIRLQFDDGSSWPPLFHGANLRGLESVKFVPSQSAQINGFLEEFKKVAGSFQNTLSEFYFRTSQSWNPSYASLLEFRKLKILEIEFSCHNRCSSQVGDDVVLSIAEAMPRLEILRLGQATCSNPTGATVKSLAALAHYCPQLSKLRIHLRLGESARTEQTPSPKRAVAIPQADCALTELEVGEASVPSGTSGKLAVALTLAQLFPQLNNIHYVNPQWKFVQETVTLSKVMGNRIHDIRSALA